MANTLDDPTATQNASDSKDSGAVEVFKEAELILARLTKKQKAVPRQRLWHRFEVVI